MVSTRIERVPKQEVQTMSNYLFNPFFDCFFEPNKKPEETSNFMNVDIYENETGYELEADLPGYAKENVNIEFSKGYLTITAAKEHKAPEGAKQVYAERNYGRLRRRFYFGEIDEENISAKLENGVMTIIIPKLTKAKTTKTIQIA